MCWAKGESVDRALVTAQHIQEPARLHGPHKELQQASKCQEERRTHPQQTELDTCLTAIHDVPRLPHPLQRLKIWCLRVKNQSSWGIQDSQRS